MNARVSDTNVLDARIGTAMALLDREGMSSLFHPLEIIFEKFIEAIKSCKMIRQMILFSIFWQSPAPRTCVHVDGDVGPGGNGEINYFAVHSR
jgi:hypothetical protein